MAKELQELPPFLTREEVANLLRVTIRSISRLVSQGRLRTLKLSRGPGGGRVLIARRELERFLDEAANG